MIVYPKHFFNTNPQERPRTCFVVMPFADTYDSVYQAIKDVGDSPDINVECVRGDEIQDSHILEIILREIGSSQLIIADLTGKNPNVFYELGLAHCVKEPGQVILITQNIDDVPFDIKQYRCFQYENSENGLIKLKEEIRGRFLKCYFDQIPIVAHEGQKVQITRLTGEENYIFDVEFEFPYIARSGAKFQIQYTRKKFDGTVKIIPGGGGYIGKENPVVELSHIPWNLVYVRVEDDTLKAVLQNRESKEKEQVLNFP